MKASFFQDALADNTSGVAVGAEALIVEDASNQIVIPCRNLDVQQFERLGLCDLEAQLKQEPQSSGVDQRNFDAETFGV